MDSSPLYDVHYSSGSARAKRRLRGPWVERRGPRKAATAAALFFGLGLLIGGIGLAVKQSYLVFLGMGVVGGVGCGLGYTGQHPGEMVSGSPRNGHGHGYYGLRRRGLLGWL